MDEFRLSPRLGNSFLGIIRETGQNGSLGKRVTEFIRRRGNFCFSKLLIEAFVLSRHNDDCINYERKIDSVLS